MAKMNYDAAKRREWKAEARRERAREIEHNAVLRQAEWESRQNQPASERQIGLINRHKMHLHYGHTTEFFDGLTKKQASDIIEKFGKEHKWKPSAAAKTYADKKKKEQTQTQVSTAIYQPWKSSDVKVTSMSTGEVRIEKNKFKQ